MIKTAIIGASGFVGGHLYRACRDEYPDAVGTTFSAGCGDLVPFDIRRPDLGKLRLEENGHEAVLIASAKPNIEFCERERDAAYAVNVAGTLELIRQISRTSMQVIFLSSDYVFDGRTGQYDDDAPANPTTEYGRQKAAVEMELPKATDNYLILRLSKIYGTKKGDRTLLDDLAGSLAAGKKVRAARDQFFCPTYIGDLVRAVDLIQGRGLRGTLNVCNAQPWSRYQIAEAVGKALEIDPNLVEAINLHDIPSMAGRPLNTTMKSSRLAREGPIEFEPLAKSIERIASQWKITRSR